MKRQWWLSLLTSVIVLLHVRAANAHGNDPHARIAANLGWSTSLSTAKDKARQTGKPIMLVLRCFD
jgi:hypothetical protein